MATEAVTTSTPPSRSTRAAPRDWKKLEALPRAPELAAPRALVLGWALYAALVLALVLLVKSGIALPGGRKTLFAVGALGAWRFSWYLLNVVRAFVYQHHRFPALRREAQALGDAGKAPEVYFLVTSYKMKPEVTTAVFQAIFAEARAYGQPATVVAAMANEEEEALVKDIFRRAAPPASIAMILFQQRGIGKRDAMAEILRAIARRSPAPGSVILFMDGDTLLTPGTLGKCLPFFRLRPELGALTTDERAIVSGTTWAKEWYEMRFAQRHVAMSSVGLSDRVLTLTGRLSMFRAEIALCRSFIEIVERDILDHWRLGRIQFLTGDDKSTWFWALKEGWAMMYVPDVQAYTYDELPSASFVGGSVRLMTRWFGNMLRNNGRAVALGPRPMGFFTWWSILDQRISIWTSLTGPTFAVIAAATRSPGFLAGYFLWVLLVKGAQTALVGLQRRRVSPFAPYMLFYNQVVGSLVKLHVSFRLDRQRWTRQKISSDEREGAGARVRRIREATTIGLQTAAVAAFVALMCVFADVLKLPSAAARAGLGADAPDAGELEALLRAAPPGGVVRLEARAYRLARPFVIGRDDVTIAGAGPGKTIIEASFPGDGAAVIRVEGALGSEARGALERPASEQDRALHLSGLQELRPQDFLSIEAPDDRGRARQALAQVERIEDGDVSLARPLGAAFPAGAAVARVTLRRGVALRGFTIRYDLGGAPADALYADTRPRNEVDGIAVVGAAGVEIRDVEVLAAGRHPLVLERTYEPRVLDVLLAGSWNKGLEGGCLRVAGTSYGVFDGVRLRGLRHLALEQSSHDNVVARLDADCGVLFRTCARRNRVRADRLEARPGPLSAPVARAPEARGEGNVVMGADGRELPADEEGD
jgi:glycosyltransferase Alg8